MKGRSNTDALAFSEFILTLMFWLAKPKSEKIYNLLKGSESNVQLTNPYKSQQRKRTDFKLKSKKSQEDKKCSVKN